MNANTKPYCNYMLYENDNNTTTNNTYRTTMNTIMRTLNTSDGDYGVDDGGDERDNRYSCLEYDTTMIDTRCCGVCMCCCYSSSCINKCTRMHVRDGSSNYMCMCIRVMMSDINIMICAYGWALQIGLSSPGHDHAY